MAGGVTGTFGTGQFTQSMPKPSFAQQIIQQFPQGEAPLFGMTSMLDTETATQVEHGYFSETMIFPEFTLAANISATDTVFSVVTTANLLPNQVHQIASTGENVLIDSVISNNQIRVVRAQGSVGAAAANSGGKAYQVGTAFEQGSIRPPSLKINPVRITNFTQIFRNSWAITGTAAATALQAGDAELAKSRRQCAAFHSADIEKALFFSQKLNSQRNGQVLTMMDGLRALISNLSYYPSYYSSPNVFTAGSTTNFTQLEGFIDPVFNQRTDKTIGSERVMFVGGTALKAINKCLRLNCTYEVRDDSTMWGLSYRKFKVTRGTIMMVEHPLFNSNADWSKLAFVIDMSTYNLAYLRKTMPQDWGGGTMGDDNGQDAQGGTLTTELTQLVKNIPANAIITNLTDGALG